MPFARLSFGFNRTAVIDNSRSFNKLRAGSATRRGRRLYHAPRALPFKLLDAIKGFRRNAFIQ